MTEDLLSERERELAEAKEKAQTLSDDLIASQGKVCGYTCTLSYVRY